LDQINFRQNNLSKTITNNMYTKNSKTYTNMGGMEMSENLVVPANNDIPLELFK
jgi:hypothetical protein